jgi:hypothetical protein
MTSKKLPPLPEGVSSFSLEPGFDPEKLHEFVEQELGLTQYLECRNCHLRTPTFRTIKHRLAFQEEGLCQECQDAKYPERR